jgi:hypothetical protein
MHKNKWITLKFSLGGEELAEACKFLNYFLEIAHSK